MTSDMIMWITLLAVVSTGVATVILAWKTSNMARSTEEELKAVQEQLRLVRQEFEDRRQAALPKFEIEPDPVVGLAGAVLRYVHGTDPAFLVEAWARTPADSFWVQLNTLTPTNSTIDLQGSLQPLEGQATYRWPFPPPGSLQHGIGSNAFWAGVTWIADDSRWGFLWEFDLTTGLRSELFAGRLGPALDAGPYTRGQAMTEHATWHGLDIDD
jgi:hypothetical protein